MALYPVTVWEILTKPRHQVIDTRPLALPTKVILFSSNHNNSVTHNPSACITLQIMALICWSEATRHLALLCLYHNQHHRRSRHTLTILTRWSGRNLQWELSVITACEVRTLSPFSATGQIISVMVSSVAFVGFCENTLVNCEYVDLPFDRRAIVSSFFNFLALPKFYKVVACAGCCCYYFSRCCNQSREKHSLIAWKSIVDFLFLAFFSIDFLQ